MAPGDVDADLEHELDEIVSGHDVETIATIDDEELSGVRERLELLEHEVSGKRRELFDRIDALREAGQ